MKLPQLLAQFLYQHKKLDLPGIGSFTLDSTVVIPDSPDKALQTPASGISFKNATIQAPDDDLILFIKEHTGKMKPLAAADLDFYLTTGRQLLNIGKAFYLDGIGTLLKKKDGKLDFTPGEYSTARLEEPSQERKKKNTPEEVSHEYEPAGNNNSTNTRQILLLVGIVLGIAAIAWGGYYLYKRNTYVETSTENAATVVPDTNNASAPASSDSTNRQSAQAANTPATSRRPDSTSASVPATTPGTELYKFVILETTSKGRALRRYNQLLGYKLNIKMDEKDSSYFKIYFPITAAPRDTAHIRDSLADQYAQPHVIIEH